MRMLLLLVFVFFAMDLSAQTDKGTRTASPSQQESNGKAIVHVDQFLSGQQARSGAAQVRSLMNDVQPSTYVESGSVKTYGDDPVCLYTDVKSFSSLAALNVSQEVQMITVKFKSAGDLSSPLDFSVLSAFPKLQYVYLVSETNVAGPRLASLVKNNDPRYNVFYNILITH
ncbi:hypothetical protein [Flavobacterium selenitireducens]|uniref:hypothetical protein n=1 Tax=Flavobacterium selenitireducens TaxID=2722704 RepID=UPI00168BAFFA|nr:hypothetical protein [Flavobacterium selenitireducens]